MVSGSFDPNDKIARTSSASSSTQYFIDQDEYVDYTIRFQNTGTAVASLVVVTDTLSADLDMLAFEQGTASHPFAVSFKPGRVVEWRFANINLPDSGSDEAESHGLVNFRIRPVQPLLLGTVISNAADIYFDFNYPVITEPSVITAEFSTGVEDEVGEGVTLYPVPATDQLRITSDGTIEEITILSVDGREVLRRAVRTSNTAMDISGLRSGTYFLIATLSDGRSTRQHFIKL